MSGKGQTTLFHEVLDDQNKEAVCDEMNSDKNSNKGEMNPNNGKNQLPSTKENQLNDESSPRDVTIASSINLNEEKGFLNEVRGTSGQGLSTLAGAGQSLPGGGCSTLLGAGQSPDGSRAEPLVALVGGGYVGLVSAVCFVDKGYSVVLVERDGVKRELLSRGRAPFFEPGLDALVAKAVSSDRFLVVETVAQALVYEPGLVMLCVGTPSHADGSVDLSSFYGVVDELKESLNHSCLVVTKSTVPVGTTKMMASKLNEVAARRGINVSCASNPEFLRQGCAVLDTMYPDRVVIGTSNDEDAAILKKLYEPFVTNDAQCMTMSIESAELAKYTANTMLALRISFMNQMARLADAAGADIAQIKRAIGADKRIGNEFLNAGIGYGGSCFPKDVQALVHIGKRFNVPMTLAQEIEQINQSQRSWFVGLMRAYYAGSLKDKTVGVWGLSFKPNTDDIRSAPSLDMIRELCDEGAKVVAYDPQAMPAVKKVFGDRVAFVESASEVLERSDCLLLITEWREFTACEYAEFLKLKDRVVFDGRNCLDPARMKECGVALVTVGRCAVTGAQPLSSVAVGERVLMKGPGQQSLVSELLQRLPVDPARNVKQAQTTGNESGAHEVPVKEELNQDVVRVQDNESLWQERSNFVGVHADEVTSSEHESMST